MEREGGFERRNIKEAREGGVASRDIKMARE